MSRRQPTPFYLPAMATLSNVPGRIGRRLSSLGRDRSQHRGPTPSPEPVRAFYMPGMAVISAVPGRLERVLAAALRDHGGATRIADVRERVREFYLPATFRR